MRFLIREQDFETPLASGRFHYSQNGRATGAIESWRLTEIAEGYTFLRVDMDTRDTAHDRSMLYHLLVDPDGRPERLKARLLAMDGQLEADISFEPASVMVSGEAEGRRFEDELHLEGNYRFWFPSATGLAMLVHNARDLETLTAVTLSQEEGLQLTHREIDILSQPEEDIKLGRQELVVRPYLIRWADHEQKLWLDKYRWPLRVDFGHGQVANETQYIRQL